jgi:hypothetical protein
LFGPGHKTSLVTGHDQETPEDTEPGLATHRKSTLFWNAYLAIPVRPRAAACLPLRTARISALRQLVLAVPAPVIADALGFHHTTTTRQHVRAGATWSQYAAGDHHAR